MRPLVPFARRFLRHRWKLLAGFLCVPLSQLADVGITLAIGDALNRLARGETEGFLQRVFVAVLLLAAVHGVLRFLTRWWVVSASRLFERDLKQELFEKLTSLSLGFHGQSRSGDVVSRLTSDVENLRMFLGPGLMYSCGAFVILPVGFVVLGSIDAVLTMAMVLPLLAIGLFMRVLGPRIYRASKSVQESQAEIAHRAQEDFAGIRVIQGYAREAEEKRRFAASSLENMENQVELARARGLTHAAVQGSFQLTFAVILGLGGLALVRGGMEAGDLFKFLDLTIKMFWPVIALGWIAGMFPRALASALRVAELLERAPDVLDPPAPREPERLRGALELEDVSFTYEGAPRPALQGIRAAVPAGGTLGVVGPTGSGKSTLLNLLGRLHDARGSIRLDGIPVARYRLDVLRGALGYVPQDGFLFSDTWRANVGFGVDRELVADELERLAELACVREEVERLPDGYDQLIGERGVTLSGGQRQRTCIARALARDPRVLILDDCLSAVDTETEARLLANLRRAGSGRTVIVAAHRLSTMTGADHILVLDADGRLAAEGTHAELVAQPGWYRETWIRQQRREELEEL